MNTKQFTVNEDCIGCQACVGVASDNFDIDKNNKAFLKKQPINETEMAACNEAMDICPVDAIKQLDNEIEKIKPVLATSNIKEVLDKYPDLKKVLVKLSDKFERLQNPVLYKTLARFANFRDAAKLTGVSICEILHTINSYLGVSEELIKIAPECIANNKDNTDKVNKYRGESITWDESPERYILNEYSLPKITEKIVNLLPQENIVLISVDEPVSIIKVVAGLGFKYNIKQDREFRLSVFNPKQKEKINWYDRKDEFEVLDVRQMMSDPFDIIIKKAYDTPEDGGFKLVQRFEPFPIINMLEEMGFESVTHIINEYEVWVYFHKIPKDNSENRKKNTNKPEVIIQSATPVAYPVIMRLLQSEKLRQSVNIKELKVWEETEKHLGWIVNKKADISFSALITSSKLKNNDVKVPAIFVWDNFSILTRGYKAENLEDLIGHEIETPLFADAPPAKITKYLIEAKSLNYDDFKFKYGKPFGRPEEIFMNFVRGDSDTVILREPEVSYAIKAMEKMGETVSIISYNKIWNEINENFGSFPNAGILFKGEFTRKYPKETEVVLSELKSAIEWVNSHKQDAANLSFDMMRQPPDNVELFLNRVNFDYVSGEQLLEKVKKYFEILINQGVLDTTIDKEFLDMFKL